MDTDGSVVNFISAVTEHSGRLFFGNVAGDYVSYIDTKWSSRTQPEFGVGSGANNGWPESHQRSQRKAVQRGVNVLMSGVTLRMRMIVEIQRKALKQWGRNMHTLQQCPHASRMIYSHVYSWSSSNIQCPNSIIVCSQHHIVTSQHHICTRLSKKLQRSKLVWVVVLDEICDDRSVQTCLYSMAEGWQRVEWKLMYPKLCWCTYWYQAWFP